MREDILRERYFRKDSRGNVVEDWPKLCERVSEAIAATAEQKREFFDVIQDRRRMALPCGYGHSMTVRAGGYGRWNRALMLVFDTARIT